MDENINVLNEQAVDEIQLEDNEKIWSPQQPEPKPLFELTKGDNIFAICMLVASVFTSVFGIFGGFSFGYLISMVMFISVFTVYFIKCKNVSIFSLLCIALSLGNSAVFITTTNGSVKFFGVIISFMLLVVGTYGLALGKTAGNRATFGIIGSALSTIGNIGVSVKSLLSGSEGSKKSIGKVMLGLLCAIPVLVVVVPLLIKSDDAFSGMMNNIFNGSGNGFLTILKAVFGAVLSLFVIAYGFSLKFNRISPAKQSKSHSIDTVCMISFLSAIAACYVLYLFSQLAYFFSAFKGFLPNQNITYSEYARKGFFEMCIIAVINLVLVFLSLLLAKKQDGKVSVGIRIISTFIAVFTLMIIATAISKMVLYISEYGMTILRITTSAFMVFLAVTFFAVILRIYLNNINIVKTTLVTAGIIVLLLGTVNVNAVCAKYNYNSYKSSATNKIDVEAMYNLGDEGIPYLAKLACSKNKEVSNDAKHYLAKAYMEDYFVNMHFAKGFDTKALKQHQKHKSFSYFSLPKSRAYNVLYAFLDKNPQFDKVCLEYYSSRDSIYDLW